MSERLPSSTAGATTWRLTGSSELLSGDQVVMPSLRRSLLLANMAGFLGGYFVLHNQWLQLGWGMILAVLWLVAGGHRDIGEALRKDRWMQASLALGACLLLRSSFLDSSGKTLSSMWLGWGNSFLLLGFLLTLWQVARLPGIMVSLGRPLVTMAALAACVSLVGFYTVHPEGVFGASLRNCCVYGGWNSVCSGLTFGFALCWAISAWDTQRAYTHPRGWVWAMVPLFVATLLTLSRGAVLALVCGHAALFLSVGWKRAKRPLILLVSVLALFQLLAPILSFLAAQDASNRLGIEDRAIAVAQYGNEMVKANPMMAALERSDNGRFIIYGAVLNSLTGWQDWLFGKGLWAENDCWSCSLHWYPEHTHGVFWDTLVHGGLLILLPLAGVVVWALSRAYHLAKMGESTWILLAGFGLGGLLFDGDSVWKLISVARYEPLLFWTPLVMASARFTQLSEQRSRA